MKKLISLLAVPLLILSGCGSPYQPEEEQKENAVQIEQNDSVPPDGVLETVTWNLLGYGTGFTGPSNWDLQTKNIVAVVDSLGADLYAFQEVADQEALDNIVQYMNGYSGFTASHVPRDQDMAFVYNTNAIDSLEAGPIDNTDIGEAYQNKWDYYWANGRTPLFFRFNYTYENTTEEFYAVVIHGKANTEDYAESYKRRQMAAEGLYYYLRENKPDANIILLGDYNDDVDQSIYYVQENNDRVYQETPYDEFIEDTDNFNVLTKKLSNAGESASVNYDEIIDHITISNELFDEHIQNSTLIHDPRSYIDNYENTTSDHLPVWAKFDITSAAVAKTVE